MQRLPCFLACFDWVTIKWFFLYTRLGPLANYRDRMQRAWVRDDFAQDISEFASTWGIKCYKNRKKNFSNVFQAFYISSMNNWNNAFFVFFGFCVSVNFCHRWLLWRLYIPWCKRVSKQCTWDKDHVPQVLRKWVGSSGYNRPEKVSFKAKSCRQPQDPRAIFITLK